jgi:hypothetical protein
LLDDLPGDEVRVQNLLGTGDIDVRIPYGFGIDGDHRPIAALSHASRVIDANTVLNAGCGSALFECGKNQIATLPRTRSA